MLSLTPDGRLINDVHSHMHDEMKRGLNDFLSRYSKAELSVLEKMLRDLLATKKSRRARRHRGIGRRHILS